MLKVENISFAYHQKTVLNNLSFTAKAGEHIAIIGESGCGKTTLLKAIYGLFNIEKGALFWKEKQLLGPNFNIVPGEDFIKYIAQDFDLMPFISVEENVGKFLSNFDPAKKAARTRELLEVIEMTEYAKTKVQFLSGGQQQRIAIARALAKEPELLLLDEPFSQVDNFRKSTLRKNLFYYLKEHNICSIIATHDSKDALAYADRMIVMKNGNIHRTDTPLQIYMHPNTPYVASLMGMVNILPYHYFAFTKNFRDKVILYPHELQITEEELFKTEIRNSFYQGSYYLIEATFKGQIILFNHKKALPSGSSVFLTINQQIPKGRVFE